MKSKDKSVDEKEVLESDEAVDLSPEGQVEALKLEIEKHNEQLMRVAADFDNFRKRVDRDREQQSLRIKGDIVSKFLDIIDTIDKAKESEYPDLESSLDGISGIQKLVSAFMESVNIEKFVPEGESFDFRFHEALTTVEKEGIESDMVVEVIQSGYKLDGELLRAAKVVVSKNSEEKEGE
jgi:molecular chaperone GrpE